MKELPPEPPTPTLPSVLPGPGGRPHMQSLPAPPLLPELQQPRRLPALLLHGRHPAVRQLLLRPPPGKCACVYARVSTHAPPLGAPPPLPEPSGVWSENWPSGILSACKDTHFQAPTMAPVSTDPSDHRPDSHILPRTPLSLVSSLSPAPLSSPPWPPHSPVTSVLTPLSAMPP